VPLGDVEFIDRRIVRLKPSGNIRLTFISWLLTAYSRDGTTIDRLGKAFLPQSAYETFGVEDPRLVRFADRCYFTYVAVSQYGIVTALASTSDFVSFQRHGIIFCPENKDVILFPEKIDGRYVALHRPNPQARLTAPEIWIARSPDLICWGQHARLLGSEVAWATAKIGGGTPPVRTDRGWLSFFHGHIASSRPGEVGQYAAGAMLLDLAQPERVLGLTPQPLMVAQEEFERTGFLPDIVFPTGLVRRGNDLLVYYGAADTSTGVARYALDEVLDAIQPM
jgi:beta-1,2-mannobiose phosphorylase / 1,2-beta-oligomannan phosphorylase